MSGAGTDELNLSFDDAQAAIAGAVEEFCRDHCGDDVVRAASGSCPPSLWRALAELGIFEAACDETDGGAREIVAAVESLGRAAFPGPLAATFFAARLVDAPEREALLAGETRATVGRFPLFPHAREAALFFDLGSETVRRVQVAGPVEPVEVLGGGGWGRVQGDYMASFARAENDVALYQIALAAQLVGLADALVAAAVDHAGARRQFGRPIGDFQAVSHPLADVRVGLDAARLVTRGAADAWDRSAPNGAIEAATAHLSARRAAVEAAHVTHQVFGAVGITREGPAWGRSSRIMQLAAFPPAPRDLTETLFEQIGTTG